MKFELDRSIELLERTPLALEALLNGMDREWLHNNEGGSSWTPYQVVVHLIHAEQTNWIPRMESILSSVVPIKFEPFDRFAQLNGKADKSIQELTEMFKRVRKQSLQTLRSKKITTWDLNKTGIHPQFGIVTLQQLLATWTVHDLTHLSQIVRVMAKQYATEVGPWIENLSVLRGDRGEK